MQDMGYIPISVKQTREILITDILERFKRVNKQEVNTFTRQLYALQKAGLPLLSSLEAISQQTRNKYFKLVIMDISARIRSGSSFSDSMKGYNKIFDPVYVSMIRAAESSGSMVEILDKLSSLIEQEIDTRARIKAATRYPSMAFFVLCLGFLVVVVFVIPRFAVIYSQFNTALPLPTRILIQVNLLIQRFWYLFLSALTLVVVVFRYWIVSRSGRPVWDDFKLKIPILGELLTMLIMSRFARITALLIKSGVPILEVLDLVSSTSGNIIISRAIVSIKESVNQGRGLSEPMKVSGLFPPMVVQMVGVGEQTGKIDELLLNVADFYDRESGYLIKNLSAYIEPVLIFVLAFMVLLMALAVFLPMWNLIKLFQ